MNIIVAMGRVITIGTVITIAYNTKKRVGTQTP